MGRLLLQLLLNSIIVINATSFLCGSSYTKSGLPNRYRLPDNVIPEHYNIKLEPHFETEGKSFNFLGRCEAYVKIISPTRCISLHAQKPQIEIKNTSFVINTESLYHYKPTYVTYNDETHILIFHFDYELSNGHYKLNMNFIGLSDNDGYFFKTPYINHNGNKRWFVALQFPVIGARQLFPCWDEPALKATFNISVRHHKNYYALSSMPEQKTYVYNNMVWTYFKTTRLISTYLVTLALYDGDSEIYALYNGDAQYHRVLSIDTLFARNLVYDVSMRFKLEWEYFANVPHFYFLITPAGPRHNGMGLILFKVSNVFYDETLDPGSQKMKAACVIAYEVVRQWFNYVISPSWWSDYWLNEGIARLLGMDIVNKMFPESSMLDVFAVQSKQECLYLDHFESGIMNPLILEVKKSSEIDSLFSFSYYIKAPVILRMLQQFLSDDVFKEGIEYFLDRHTFSSATIDDFWNVMQDAQDVMQVPYHEKFNVKEMMNTWTKQKHYPVLKISNNIHYYFTIIENVDYMVKDDWFIPITVTIVSSENQTYTRKSKFKTQMNYHDTTNNRYDLDIPYYQDYLIIVNFLGYYRVNYELKNWRNIAEYLNSGDYKKIHVLDRAQIIDDAFYFFSMGQLDMFTFWELTKYLSQETHYVPWYPMIKALEHMSSFLPILDESNNLIKKYMLPTLNKVLEFNGYGEYLWKELHLLNCLSQEIAKWACILEDPKCLQMAKNKLEQHIIEHKKLLPWWKEWTYCNGIKTEKNLTGIWKTVFQKWLLNPNDKIFEFLTCITHPNSIKTYLNDNNLEETVSLKNISFNFRTIDRVNRFLFTIIKHAKNDEIFEYILNNFEALKPREVNTVALLIIIINHVYFDSQLDKVREYTRYLIEERIVSIHYKIEKRRHEIKLLKNRIKVFE